MDEKQIVEAMNKAVDYIKRLKYTVEKQAILIATKDKIIDELIIENKYYREGGGSD